MGRIRDCGCAVCRLQFWWRNTGKGAEGNGDGLWQ